MADNEMSDYYDEPTKPFRQDTVMRITPPVKSAEASPADVAVEFVHNSVAFSFLRLMHDAIRVSLGYIEMITNTLTPVQLPHLVKAFEGVALFIYLHTAQEEKALFPALNAKQEGLCAVFSSDHGKDLTQMTYIKQLLVELVKDKLNERKGESVRQAILHWVQDHRRHMKLEEQYLKPVLSRESISEEEGWILVRNFISVDLTAWKNFELSYAFERLSDPSRYSLMHILYDSLPENLYDDSFALIRPLMSPENLSAFEAADLCPAPPAVSTLDTILAFFGCSKRSLPKIR